jgi:hypothetical protein
MSFTNDSHRPQNQLSLTIDPAPTALTSMPEDYTTEQNTTACYAGTSDSYSGNGVDGDSPGWATGE